MIYQKPKGTSDILPSEVGLWHYIEANAREIANEYAYREIRVPTFENLGLFRRSSGETSDVVSKEMYEFIDKGKREMALRPEGTAGIVRAFIENKLYGPEFVQPLKVFYQGSMFRYERPQSGRNREFHQFGVEAFGVKDPRMDAETIIFGCRILKRLGLDSIKVVINSLGDQESRQNYLKALVDYLTPFESELSDDSKIRLQKNPLRILDSKDSHDQEIIKNAPMIKDYLTDESRGYFDEVLHYLDLLEIPYQIDNDLVRGLDYYNHTIFELVYHGEAFGGHDLTVLAGGRYDHLVKNLGGPDVPGVGFAFGEERIVEVLKLDQKLKEQVQNKLDVFLVSIEEGTNDYIFTLAEDLRNKGFSVAYDLSGRSLKSQLKLANRYQSKFTILIGKDELVSDNLTVKNMDNGKQFTIKSSEINLERLMNNE